MTKNNNIAKIMITYGPILDSSENLEEIIGHSDIIRINMSHGSLEQWSKYTKKIRDISNRIGKKIELCADLPGPKIRVNNIDADLNASGVPTNIHYCRFAHCKRGKTYYYNGLRWGDK